MNEFHNPYARALDGLVLDDPVSAFFDFCREREKIRLARESGAPVPWTDDPIFQKGRFLNVFREDDRGSKTIFQFAKNLKPSSRGELEITDLNNIYLKESNMDVEILGRGFTWLDTGTFDSLLEASQLVQTIQNNQGLKIACLEEIAFKKNWIDLEQIRSQANKLKNSHYGEYLKTISKD